MRGRLVCCGTGPGEGVARPHCTALYRGHCSGHLRRRRLPRAPGACARNLRLFKRDPVLGRRRRVPTLRSPELLGRLGRTGGRLACRFHGKPPVPPHFCHVSPHVRPPFQAAALLGFLRFAQRSRPTSFIGHAYLRLSAVSGRTRKPSWQVWLNGLFGRVIFSGDSLDVCVAPTSPSPPPYPPPSNSFQSISTLCGRSTPAKLRIALCALPPKHVAARAHSGGLGWSSGWLLLWSVAVRVGVQQSASMCDRPR